METILFETRTQVTQEWEPGQEEYRYSSAMALIRLPGPLSILASKQSSIRLTRVSFSNIVAKMDMLHIFLIATFSIPIVTSLPQNSLDWSLVGSSDQLAYDTSSFLPADGSNMFSSDSVLATNSQTTDLDSYDPASLPLDSGATSTPGDSTLWDDSGNSLTPDTIATGCSGTFGKRAEAGATCGVPEEDLCDPDKEAMCCSPTWMYRSRWAGSGFNMDGCVERTYLVLGVEPAYFPYMIPYIKNRPD